MAEWAHGIEISEFPIDVITMPRMDLQIAITPGVRLCSTQVRNTFLIRS
jgi:hypothetical protein